MARPFTIASNQGSIGGGEVMLFAIAEAARELGRDVTIVAPQTPGEVVQQAQERGFRVIAIAGKSTATYLANLRRWDARERRGLLWCNGLRPAFATAGHPNRVVELHQRPLGKLKVLARVAVKGARRVVVPSLDMAAEIPDAAAFWNWSEPLPVKPHAEPSRPFVVGFLGRLSSDKGMTVLCDAFTLLAQRHPDRYKLLLGGESRFVEKDDADQVEQALAELGDAVDDRGWMERDDFFGEVDLAVFPSVWPEPFGLVVTEAMASRTPFVISDAGALPEVAGPDAWIASAGDAEALADAIEAAAADPQRHVEEAYRRWRELFSPEAGRQRLRALLAELEGAFESTDEPRVALVHDYLTQRGGAERVALELMRVFPNAPLTTSLYDPAGTYSEFADVDVRTSWLNKIAPLRSHFRAALPLFPLAYSTTTAGQDADVVVVSTTGFAHGVRTPPGVRKIVYCHSPARFLYLTDEYLGKPWWKSPQGWALQALKPALIAWDQRAARSADLYLCNSTVVKERIKRVYGIDAEVVFPPASLDPNDPREPIELPWPVAGDERAFYLVVSRLMPYKNVDVVIDAFREMPERKLLIIGRGPLGEQLRASAPANVHLVEGLSDAQMRWAYAHALAVIAPSYEDFGLSPIEGFRFGTPALALRAGGYLDTVVEGASGWFFDVPTATAIRSTVEDAQLPDAEGIRVRGAQFAPNTFARDIEKALRCSSRRTL